MFTRSLKSGVSGLFHIIVRGVDRRWIFETPGQREDYINRLGDRALREGVNVATFVVMSNHLHLLVDGEKTAISRMMHTANRLYSKRYNLLHERKGALYERRYMAYAICSNGWAINRSRYLHLNPVIPRMCDAPEDYPWSSMRAYAGLTKPPDWLNPWRILKLVDPDPEVARRQYLAFVRKGMEEPLVEVADSEFDDERAIS